MKAAATATETAGSTKLPVGATNDEETPREFARTTALVRLADLAATEATAATEEGTPAGGAPTTASGAVAVAMTTVPAALSFEHEFARRAKTGGATEPVHRPAAETATASQSSVDIWFFPVPQCTAALQTTGATGVPAASPATASVTTLVAEIHAATGLAALEAYAGPALAAAAAPGIQAARAPALAAEPYTVTAPAATAESYETTVPAAANVSVATAPLEAKSYAPALAAQGEASVAEARANLAVAAAAESFAGAVEGSDRCVHCEHAIAKSPMLFASEAVHATAVFPSRRTDGQRNTDEQEEERRLRLEKPSFETSDSGSVASGDSEEEDEEIMGPQSHLEEDISTGKQPKRTLLFSRDTDVMYEQELQRDPFQVKIWCRYLDSKKEDSPAERFWIYERALSSVPGSYKLWWRYLQERVAKAAGDAIAAAAVRSASMALSGTSAAAVGEGTGEWDVEGRAAVTEEQAPTSGQNIGKKVCTSAQRRSCEEVNKVFERALVLLLHMPKMWIFYLRFLQYQQLITRTRRALDRALQSVAITQHDSLWRSCMRFFREKAPVETTVRLYRRCIMRLPEETETFVDYLQQPHVGHYDHAAELLAELVEDDTRSSLAAAAAGGGKTKHQLWLQLCDLVAAHPASIRSLDPEKVLRSGIARFSDEVGRLWCSLASIFLRLGEIEKARDIFEEAVQSVRTVQDLALVYDAYLSFEESLLAAKIEQQQQRRNNATLQGSRGKSEKKSDVHQHTTQHAATGAWIRSGGSGADERGIKTAAGSGAIESRRRGRKGEKEDGEQALEKSGDDNEEEEQEIDYLMTRLEYLTERRPLLVSSCKLRQNPHNVHEWLARAELFAHDLPKVVETFSEAVASVDPQLAVGSLSVLWVAFGRFYEQHGDLPNACTLFEKGVQVNFRSVDELATVWCEYVEMLLRHNRGAEALQVVRRAINTRSSQQAIDNLSSTAGATVQNKLYRSVKLWCLAADMEEMFGSLETVRACYNKMFQLKTITPQLVINYAHLLEEHRFFEESFKVYERGIAAFRWPHLNDLWLMYLSKFVSRYGGQQLERARELFQQATTDVPPRFARRLFLLYAKLEEEFGLAKHALAIYHAATKAVLDEEKKDMYYIYIARCTYGCGIPPWLYVQSEADYCAESNRVLSATFELYWGGAEILLHATEAEQLVTVYEEFCFRCCGSSGASSSPTTELFGIARTRTIYEEAIETLPEKDARELCMRYALVERGLGEVDRSRAIYEHCSQFCDPSAHPEFWKAWKDFEVAHGNEDTFKDMLRVKRSVIAQYSQAHQNVLELAHGLAAGEEEQQAGQQQQVLATATAKSQASTERSTAELKRSAHTEQKSIEEEMFYKKKRQMDEAELAQAEAEFQAVQRQRAQARVMAALPADAPLYVASQSFSEPRVGYVFKNGFFGQGYYLDEHQVGAVYYSARVAAATARSETISAPQTTGIADEGAASRELQSTL